MEEWAKRWESYGRTDQFGYYWWSTTYPQVRDKVVAEPGWDVFALDENFDIYNALLVRNRRLDVTMVFYFTKVTIGAQGKLFKRRYIYPPGNPLIADWTERLSKLPYDEGKKYWTDAEHYAHIIRGTDDQSQVIFEVGVYSPN